MSLSETTQGFEGVAEAAPSALSFDYSFYEAQKQEALDNIQMSLAFYGDLPRLERGERKGAPVAVVGGGPSLDVEQLRDFPGPIFCSNEVHDYLIYNGIEPDGWVVLEVAPFRNRQINREAKHCTYYIPSHCDLSIFEQTEGRDVVMWHALDEIGEDALISEHEENPMLVAGSSSPSLRAIHICMVLGYTQIELFGVDASHPPGKSHVYRDSSPGTFEVTCAGRKFPSQPYLAQQADEFAGIVRNFPQITIKTHGDGLIQHIHRTLRPDVYSAEKDTL